MTLDLSQRDIVIRREFFDLCEGDLHAASFLSQIVWWFSPKENGETKLKVKREGKWWIAKTREEWMKECGLTLAQYKRVFVILKEMGLIEAKIMKFAGIAMTHIRLLINKIIPGGAKHANPPVAFMLTPWGEKNHPYTEITTESTTEKETSVLKNANLSGGDIKKDSSYSKDHNSKLGALPAKSENLSIKKAESENCMKAQDVLKNNAQKSTGTLETLWKSNVSLVYGGYQSALTAKERGQLKHLANQVGALTKDVLDFVLQDWLKFANQVKILHGLYDYPSVPDTGFLLKYHDVAVNMLQSIAKKSKEVVNSPKQEKKPISNAEVCYNFKNVLGEKDYKPYKPSAEEIAKTLSEFEKP